MPDSKSQNLEIPFDLKMLYYLKACYEIDNPPPEEKKSEKKGGDSNVSL